MAKNVKRQRLSKCSRLKAKAKKAVELSKLPQSLADAPIGPPPAIRERQNIVVVDTSKFATIPFCSHGPCLLFSDGYNRKWFSCSVFRSSKDCGFVVGVNANDVVEDYDKISRISTLPFEEYGSIMNSFKVLKRKNVKPFLCKECLKYVSTPHKHPVDGPYDEFFPPTKLLPANENAKGEAQFWFSDDTLNVIKNALTKEEVDSVLCVGTPTIFEFLGDSFKRFLLDYDDRLSVFYGNDEFARYSMLTNYFYFDESKEKLRMFFSKAKKIAIICDPPFGVFVAALLKSMLQLQEMFFESNTNEKNAANCKLLIFLPIFVAKHVLRMDSAFSVVDFKVSYKNHREFSNPDKSIVRMITNFKNKNFELPSELGYKFCKLCDRYVAEANAHCKLCKACTSKDGSKFLHCKVCKKCVKATYKHCQTCKFCHLPNRCPKSKR